MLIVFVFASIIDVLFVTVLFVQMRGRIFLLREGSRVTKVTNVLTYFILGLIKMNARWRRKLRGLGRKKEQEGESAVGGDSERSSE